MTGGFAVDGVALRLSPGQPAGTDPMTKIFVTITGIDLNGTLVPAGSVPGAPDRTVIIFSGASRFVRDPELSAPSGTYTADLTYRVLMLHVVADLAC